MTTAAVVREPLYRTVPDCRQSFGDLAARVGTNLGLSPDAEQREALDAMFAEVQPGIPRYRHWCMVATRQQIKSATMTIGAATDLLLLGVPEAVWTAHQSKTATKSYEDLARRIRGHEEYREVAGFRSGRGEEAIYLLDDPGIRLEYRARSGGSGRGFTTGRLTLDEALYLRAGDIGALAPTMLTRRDGQIRYGSSAGLPGSEVLRALRDDGRKGTDPGLWYAEYGSERRDCAQPACGHEVGTDGCALDDRELWWHSCPALWCGRVREEDIADLRRRMPWQEFAREVMGWWDEPVGGPGSAIDRDRWLSLADPAGDRGLNPVFGVDVDTDRMASVTVVTTTPDGLRTEVASDPVPAHRLSERCAELVEAWGGTIAAHPLLLDELERAGLPVVEVKAAEWPQACAEVHDAVLSERLHHGNQPSLNSAVDALRWGPTTPGGLRSFLLRDSPGAGAAFALVRALHVASSDQPADFYTL